MNRYLNFVPTQNTYNFKEFYRDIYVLLQMNKMNKSILDQTMKMIKNKLRNIFLSLMIKKKELVIWWCQMKTEKLKKKNNSRIPDAQWQLNHRASIWSNKYISYSNLIDKDVKRFAGKTGFWKKNSLKVQKWKIHELLNFRQIRRS